VRPGRVRFVVDTGVDRTVWYGLRRAGLGEVYLPLILR
jgi:hypothetical protein